MLSDLVKFLLGSFFTLSVFAAANAILSHDVLASRSKVSIKLLSSCNHVFVQLVGGEVPA